MERLKEIRKSRNFTQKQIADVLGVDRTTYVKYESGASDPPSATLIRLSAYYGVTVGYLMGVEDLSSPQPSQYDDDEFIRSVIKSFKNIPKDLHPYAVKILKSMESGSTGEKK